MGHVAAKQPPGNPRNILPDSRQRCVRIQIDGCRLRPGAGRCLRAILACLRKRQNVSSRSCREMFSKARRWSPGRSGGEIRRKNKLTVSPSRLAKSTPAGLTATVPIRRSTLGCLVWGTATPRPMPVLPNSSRFKIALTMLSNSAALTRLASTSDWTISRMAPSLSSAAMFARIASRQIKSENFMHQSPLGSHVGKVLRPVFSSRIGRAGNFRRFQLPVSGAAMAVLDLLLVFA